MKMFAVIFGVVLLVGCGESGSGSYSSSLPEASVAVDGVERAYRFAVPAASSGGSMPLLIGLHGGGMRDYPFPQEDLFTELAEEEAILIAYPLSRQLPENEGEWQLNTTDQTRQDVAFIEALIAQMSATHDVDAARIYVMGYSLGSMLAYELACQLHERVAAVASHAGTMPVSPASCEPDAGLPILHVHGEDDYIIAYGNTWDWKAWDSVGTMRDIPSLVDFWKTTNACQSTTERDFGPSTHVVHDDCAMGARVEHYRLGEAGHEWPEVIDGVSTHRVIWDFLSDFSKN
jgi:polyhydroxybutyrate depolymerase